MEKNDEASKKTHPVNTESSLSGLSSSEKWVKRWHNATYSWFSLSLRAKIFYSTIFLFTLFGVTYNSVNNITNSFFIVVIFFTSLLFVVYFTHTIPLFLSFVASIPLLIFTSQMSYALYIENYLKTNAINTNESFSVSVFSPTFLIFVYLSTFLSSVGVLVIFGKGKLWGSILLTSVVPTTIGLTLSIFLPQFSLYLPLAVMLSVVFMRCGVPQIFTQKFSVFKNKRNGVFSPLQVKISTSSFDVDCVFKKPVEQKVLGRTKTANVAAQPATGVILLNYAGYHKDDFPSNPSGVCEILKPKSKQSNELKQPLPNCFSDLRADFFTTQLRTLKGQGSVDFCVINSQGVFLVVDISTAGPVKETVGLGVHFPHDPSLQEGVDTLMSSKKSLMKLLKVPSGSVHCFVTLSGKKIPQNFSTKTLVYEQGHSKPVDVVHISAPHELFKLINQLPSIWNPERLTLVAQKIYKPKGKVRHTPLPLNVSSTLPSCHTEQLSANTAVNYHTTAGIFGPMFVKNAKPVSDGDVYEYTTVGFLHTNQHQHVAPLCALTTSDLSTKPSTNTLS